MYRSLVTINGATAVGNFVGSSTVQDGPDGLVFAPANGGQSQLAIPARLMEWLTDLRLLRHIPLVYLVPDSALLPTESIRFFHVDTTWVDRVIDGVFSAANLGTTEAIFSYGILSSARAKIDGEIEKIAATKAPSVQWSVADGMTGMLIRSELARRWPDMIVEGWTDIVSNWSPPVASKNIAVLRAESISKDIFIVLFAGKPKMVTIREPFTGTRFGVESKVPDSQTAYKVDSRKSDGTAVTPAVALDIAWRGPATARVIDFTKLAAKGTVPGSIRQLVLNLEQKPYMQEFKDDATHAENLGSQDFVGDTMTFRRGRKMNFKNLQIRLDQQKEGV